MRRIISNSALLYSREKGEEEEGRLAVLPFLFSFHVSIYFSTNQFTFILHLPSCLFHTTLMNRTARMYQSNLPTTHHNLPFNLSINTIQSNPILSNPTHYSKQNKRKAHQLTPPFLFNSATNPSTPPPPINNNNNNNDPQQPSYPTIAPGYRTSRRRWISKRGICCCRIVFWVCLSEFVWMCLSMFE